MTALTEPVHRAIATRRRRGQTVEQLYSVGERTGWWTGDDVDWHDNGGQGPRPDGWTLDTVTEAEPALPHATVARPPGATDSALVTAALQREARSSVNLDGETHVIGDPVPARPAGITVDVGEVVDVDPALADPADPAGVYVTALPAIEMMVDPSYQRPLDQARVHRMAKTWDPRMAGVIDVADRGPQPDDLPRYAIVAGQHRWAAAIEARGGDVWLASTVHEGLDVAAEAALMHELDRTTKKLSGHDQWRARRASGDIAVLAVEEIAARHGLRIDSALADGVLRSYGAAEKLWGAGTLDAALGVLVGAYGTSAAGTQAPLLTAVGRLLQQHADLDVDRLVRALAGARPEQLRATATALREVDPGPLHELMARAVAGAYNRTAGRGGRIAGGRA